MIWLAKVCSTSWSKVISGWKLKVAVPGLNFYWMISLTVSIFVMDCCVQLNMKSSLCQSCQNVIVFVMLHWPVAFCHVCSVYLTLWCHDYMLVVIYRRQEYKWDCLRAHTIKCTAVFWALHCALCLQFCLAPTGQDICALYFLWSMFLSSCLSYVHVSALTLGSSICQTYVCDWSECIDGLLHWNVDGFEFMCGKQPVQC